MHLITIFPFLLIINSAFGAGVSAGVIKSDDVVEAQDFPFEEDVEGIPKKIIESRQADDEQLNAEQILREDDLQLDDMPELTNFLDYVNRGVERVQEYLACLVRSFDVNQMIMSEETCPWTYYSRLVRTVYQRYPNLLTCASSQRPYKYTMKPAKPKP